MSRILMVESDWIYLELIPSLPDLRTFGRVWLVIEGNFICLGFSLSYFTYITSTYRKPNGLKDIWPDGNESSSL